MTTSVTQSFRVRDYLQMFQRHKKLFYTILAVSMLISILLVAFLPRVYRAETVLLVQDQKILEPLVNGLAIYPSMSARIRTLSQELLSWQKLTLLVEKLGLDKNIKSTQDYERLIRNIRTKLQVRLKSTDKTPSGMQNMNVISIAYEANDPRRTQQVVQALSDIIVQDNAGGRKADTSSAINFLEKEVKRYRIKLEQSEDELRKFRELYSNTFPVATKMNEQIVQLKIELNHLRAENTDKHPRVVQTKKLLQSLEKQRDEQMKQAQQEGVRIEDPEFGKLLTSVPRQMQELSRLQRNYQVNERIHNSLVERLEKARISETIQNTDSGSRFRVIEPARLPFEAVSPIPGLVLLGGLIVGLGLGALAIYVLEMNDGSIRSFEEARDVLEYPIFGTIRPIRIDELVTEDRLRRQSGV